MSDSCVCCMFFDLCLICLSILIVDFVNVDSVGFVNVDCLEKMAVVKKSSCLPCMQITWKM